MSRKPPFSETQLREALANASCWSDALRSMGYETKGHNIRTVQRWARIWEISTDHFDPNVARGRATASRAVPLEAIMVANSTYSRGKLKKRLLRAGLKQPICELCGQGEIWRGNRLSLILDHINGVPTDHRLENLRMVCPNCAATLDTHCGRNSPRERVCPGCGQTFLPRSIRNRYCSQTCWGVEAATRYRGVSHPELRKVPRPTHKQLLDDVATMSMSAIGRKYGVSDNAVRKWLRWYAPDLRKEGDAT